MAPTPAVTNREDEGAYQAVDQATTTAAFSPVTLSNMASGNRQRSTILVHQKSPLLIATPPQITRSLAYSHAFLLPLNKFVGLLTWTTGDSWESFVLVASFWAVVLDGDVVIRWGGPVVVVLALIIGMYSRRYSPLSSTVVTGEKQKKGHKKVDSEVTNTKHQKSLDEIVETLKEFTARCNMLLDPLIQLTDFLSTQRTATSTTTRPALTTLLIRISLVTPLWIALTLPPLYIITTKRVVLTTGTLILTWHSKPTRVSREILWRSAFLRRMAAAVTGLHFETHKVVKAPGPIKEREKPALPTRNKNKIESSEVAASATHATGRRRPSAAGVKFTFILYENERKWMGLGWTKSLFAYERAAWTDEQLNEAPSKEDFELPEVEGGHVRWRWVERSKWKVAGAAATKGDGSDDPQGWIYYDSKWQNGKRGMAGYFSYTRRRKWYRDAELVEVTNSTEITPSSTPPNEPVSEATAAVGAPKPRSRTNTIRSTSSKTASVLTDDSSSTKSSGFRPGAAKRTSAMKRNSAEGNRDDDIATGRQIRDGDWGIGDEARMNLE